MSCSKFQQIMFFVYVLEDLKSKETYVGYTHNLLKRLKEHNQGKNFSTKSSSWKLIYYEACLNQEDTLRREDYLKTTQGKRMLKLRIRKYLENGRKIS